MFDAELAGLYEAGNPQHPRHEEAAAAVDQATTAVYNHILEYRLAKQPRDAGNFPQ
jgi:hypothetical protein